LTGPDLKAGLVILVMVMGLIHVQTGWAAQGGAEREVIRVAAVGDVMMGTENLLPADGGESLFTEATPYLRQGDVVFCNHEGTLADNGEPTKITDSGKNYCFRTPPHYARFLAEAGFNVVSVANNHINDYGPEARQMTMETLARYGLVYSGPPGTLARLNIRGTKVVMVAFHSSAHSHWLNDIPEAVRLVSGLSKDNDLVIVSFHGGAEGEGAIRTPGEMEYFYGEPRGEVVKFSRAVVEAGADLVLGHGPHVPRAMEVHRGRLIAYSLGNFCTGRGISVKGDAGLAPLLLAELAPDGSLAGGRVVSFFQAYGRPPVLDPQNRAARLIHQLGRLDFPQSNAVAEDGSLIIPISKE